MSRLFHFANRRYFATLLRYMRIPARNSIVLKTTGCVTAGFVTYLIATRRLDWRSSGLVVHAKKKEVSDAPPKLSPRELRFIQFASIEHEGRIFMTPRDFLDSVTEQTPRGRVKRKQLSHSDVKKILKQAPRRSAGSTSMFRTLDDCGIITYTEYLFLLCVLTKPESGFEIAFNMIDIDGNGRVDKTEFLIIAAVTLLLRADGRIGEFDPYLENLQEITKQLLGDTAIALRKKAGAYYDSLEEVFSLARQKRWKKQEDARAEKKAAASPPEEPSTPAPSPTTITTKAPEPERTTMQDTTLLLHLFGKKGTDVLTHGDFAKFMDDLQQEVLEIEFNEFSHGKQTISEHEFAKILLRYTIVYENDYLAYMQRVRERIVDEKGITFDQFRKFCQFLNNLDDFSIAMKMYTFASQPVSQDEFSRAVKVSSGFALEPHVINTVFQIFDVDGDGRLSYSEFIAVMKDRVHRGFRSRLIKREGWDAFKACVREEMRNY